MHPVHSYRDTGHSSCNRTACGRSRRPVPPGTRIGMSGPSCTRRRSRIRWDAGKRRPLPGIAARTLYRTELKRQDISELNLQYNISLLNHLLKKKKIQANKKEVPNFTYRFRLQKSSN